MTNESTMHHPSNREVECSNSATAGLTAALDDGKTHLLLAASGSVAVIKLPLIISSLVHHHPKLSIRIILTQNAARFFTGLSPEQPTVASLSALPNVEAVYQDEHEWVEPWERGASILHIQLRRWSHLLVVAPLTANTLAKIAGGFSDNLLTSVIRAWDINPMSLKRRRIVIAPAMNTSMWAHPITAKQIRLLEEEWGVNGVDPDQGWFEILRPQVKTLACGDIGQGGMCDWKEIVSVIEERLCLTALESEGS
ncbi:MAG: hypothetical protein Q9163_003153 [Psora crenata]